MFHIKQYPDEKGNHGNPVSSCVPGMVALPDSLIPDYVATKGFAYLTIEGEAVTSVTINQEAYDAYEESLPDPTPPEPTEEDDVNAMLVDHEYRLTLLELGITEEV